MSFGMDWLAVHRRTLFRLRPDGRIARENDPDNSPGPSFWLAGGADGNVFGLRADLAPDVAARLETLAITEPPLAHPAIPRHAERYLAILGKTGPVEPRHLGLIYPLPHMLACPEDVCLIRSDTRPGRDLTRSLLRHGMPAGLRELGFETPEDFWPPWCVTVVDDEIVSVAFAARLSEVGAALGLATAKAARGRGYAAAATAGWSQHASLRSRSLFYSTDRANDASQRVVARLGLRLQATSLRIL